jgi:hypothetical protein
MTHIRTCVIPAKAGTQYAAALAVWLGGRWSAFRKVGAGFLKKSATK